MAGRREFIEHLIAAADEARLRPAAERGRALARRLVADFVPDITVAGHDLRRWIAPGVPPSTQTPESLTAPWDVDRFAPELTAGGQGAEALRHIAAGAAAVLAGRGLLVRAADVLDWIQGLLRGNRREAQAEIAGNRAGARLGRTLRAYLAGEFGRDVLEERIRVLLN